MYLLSGIPHVVTNHFGSAYEEYFLKHDNELLIVNDKHLRDRLQHIFCRHLGQIDSSLDCRRIYGGIPPCFSQLPLILIS